MATAEQQHDEPIFQADVIAWRFDVLMTAGYLPDQAWALAESQHVDVHLAERLLVHGCPRSTAVRILL